MARAGHEVEVTELPNCDICKVMYGQTHPATYDGKTILGPWAHMCDKMWKTYGPGRTGVGMGQKYILKEVKKDGDKA